MTWGEIAAALLGAWLGTVSAIVAIAIVVFRRGKALMSGGFGLGAGLASMPSDDQPPTS